jgi:hypothetical protein
MCVLDPAEPLLCPFNPAIVAAGDSDSAEQQAKLSLVELSAKGTRSYYQVRFTYPYRKAPCQHDWLDLDWILPATVAYVRFNKKRLVGSCMIDSSPGRIGIRG